MHVTGGTQVTSKDPQLQGILGNVASRFLASPMQDGPPQSGDRAEPGIHPQDLLKDPDVVQSPHIYGEKDKARGCFESLLGAGAKAQPKAPYSLVYCAVVVWCVVAVV